MTSCRSQPIPGAFLAAAFGVASGVATSVFGEPLVLHDIMYSI